MNNLIRSAIKAIEREKWASARRLRDNRGIALPLMAIAMVALVAMAAVGVDTGRVATVATEAQNAADVAALAGARAIADEQDPRATANVLLAQNRINGTSASIFLESLIAGNFDSEYIFTANGTPENAVKAKIVATVSTIVLAAIGRPNATVTREAIATLGGMGSAVPTLPIVIGECNYQTTCYHVSCMPRLSASPNPSNNSAWTGFFTGASTTSIRDLMPSPVGSGNTTLLKVGDYINLTNGVLTPLLNDVKTLLNDEQTTFIIPIVECGGSFNQAKQVRGFAKIVIDQVVTTGNPKGIWLHGLSDGSPGPPGGGNFGLNVVNLVQ